MAIDIDDDLLSETPQGCFYLAIAEAIEALGIAELTAIRVADFSDGPKKDGPEIVVLPLPEDESDSPLLGRYNAVYRARVVEHELSDRTSRQSLGWRLQTRYLLLRRLGGQGTTGSGLTYGDHCFTLLRPEHGPLLDDQSRQRGLARSEIIVTAEYSGL